MIVLENQTAYKCSYCGRRKWTKRGCLEHEKEYCSSALSPHKIAIQQKQNNCPHKHKEEVWSYIPGEAVKQPDYDICIDCGKHGV